MLSSTQTLQSDAMLPQPLNTMAVPSNSTSSTATMRYFRLGKDYGAAAASWQLGELVDSKGEAFDLAFQLMRGKPVTITTPLSCRLLRPGKPLDFSLTASNDIPVVPEILARRLAQLAPGDVQSIPVTVEGQKASYCLLVATRTVSCIDEAACAKVELRKLEAGGPELAEWKYQRVDGLRIDPARAKVAQLFRPAGWTVALIASERIVKDLFRMNVSGLDIESVTPPRPPNVSK